MLRITRIPAIALILAAGCGNGGTGNGPGGTNPDGTPKELPQCAPAAAGDVTVSIDPAKGPNNAPVPITLTNKLYSMNINDFRPEDYTPAVNPKFAAYLKALRPALLRWPAGVHSQTRAWTRTGASSQTTLTPADIDAFMKLCDAVGSTPLLSVNFEAGSPEAAADMVRYVNIEKKHKVVWWQIGNEPDVHGLDDTHNPAAYVTRYKQFTQAMRAVDPSIKFTGVELMTGANMLGTGGQPNWLTPILQGIGSGVDAIAWHWYPMDSGQTSPTSAAHPSVPHLLQETAQDWAPAGLAYADTIFPAVAPVRQQYAPEAEVWIDEYAEDPGPAAGAGLSDRVAGALWAADSTGRFAARGADAIFHFIFKSDAAHAYTLVDSTDNPRPEYYTYWLYAQHFGDKMVNVSQTDRSQVSVQAALRQSDNSLRVMVVNKGTTPKKVRLNLTGFVPYGASQMLLQGSSYEATTMTANGKTLSPESVAQGESAIPMTEATACAESVVTVPAYSIALVAFTR
jgi:hypothetical protein